jgi:hypothetical protein
MIYRYENIIKIWGNKNKELYRLKILDCLPQCGVIGFASDTHPDSFNLKVKLERRILTTNKIDASFISIFKMGRKLC